MPRRKVLEELRLGRRRARLTQLEAASRMGFSQPYLSQLECGERRLTAEVARAMRRLYGLAPTALPVPDEPSKAGVEAGDLPGQLSALGYPAYSHVRPRPPLNPAVVLLGSLSEDDLDARVAHALPWVLVRYPNLNWDWLVRHAKLRNLQNRLGFLVAVAGELARKGGDQTAVGILAEVLAELEKARLAAETTLCRESMPDREREWLRSNRSGLARDWNVLTDMTAEELPYAEWTPETTGREAASEAHGERPQSVEVVGPDSELPEDFEEEREPDLTSLDWGLEESEASRYGLD